MPSIQKIIGDNTHLIYSWDEAMHSRIDYIIYGNDISILEKASKEISDTLLQLENIGNRFNFKSEISTLNNCLSDKPVKVSEKLYFLLKEGKDIYNKSFGYFDMTIQSKTPEIDRWNHIFFDDDTYSISSDIDNITFDLGGYLKGVAVDGIIDILNSHNISNGFIDFGHSSVRAIGKCFDNSDWMLACKIDDEIKNIIVNDCSISTSGNETFERQHIINPKDGEYVKGVKIISVKSDTASHGEILSTVLCCLPEEKWDLILSAFNGELLH